MDVPYGEEEVELKKRNSSDKINGEKPEIEIVNEVPRTIGLFGGISFIVGTIVGSGIFVSPRGVALNSGSVAMTLLIWSLSGVISLIGALCYAELGTIIKLSGADYTYLDKAYGAFVSYQYSWVTNILVRPGQMATIALTMAEYLSAIFFMGGCSVAPDIANKLLACFFILFLAAVNINSSTLASKVQIVFTVAKLAALGVIIIGGIVKLFQGYTENLATGFEGTVSQIGLIMTAFYSGMWAYDGWNTANFITEEIINPEKNLPLSIIIGLPLVICLFVATNVAYFTVLSIPQMIASNAVALSWAAEVIPNFSWFIPLCVSLACFGTLNGYLFSGSRLIYACARNNHLPAVLSLVHVTQYTPSPAIVLSVICAIVLTFLGNVSALIDLLGFVLWLFYGLNIFAVVLCRFNKYKNVPRPFKVPIILPILASIFSVALVLVPLIVSPQIGYFYALGFIVLGYIVYIPFVYCRIQVPFMTNFTRFTQKLMNVFKLSKVEL